MKGVINTAFDDGEKLGLEKGEKLGIEKGKKNKAIEKKEEIMHYIEIFLNKK